MDLRRPRCPRRTAAAGSSARRILNPRSTLVSLLNRAPAPVARFFSTDSRAARVLRPLVNRLAPKGLTWVDVRSGPGQGISLLIDAQKEKFLWTGLHEPAVQQALADSLRPGMTFWDVGAHVGFFTVLGSRLVGEQGHVHAFEPVEANRERLQAALERNACSNVTLHPVALSSSAGEAVIHEHESSAMWSLTGAGEGQPVRTATLDSLELPPPDLVKVDVEGVELDVLGGGVRLAAEARPTLVVEFTTPQLVEQARGLLPGYRFEQLEGSHWLLRSA